MPGRDAMGAWATHTQPHTRAPTNARTHACTHAHANIYACKYTCSTYMHTRTHRYTPTCTCVFCRTLAHARGLTGFANFPALLLAMLPPPLMAYKACIVMEFANTNGELVHHIRSPSSCVCTSLPSPYSSILPANRRAGSPCSRSGAGGWWTAARRARR